jgi:GTP-binding protein
VYKVFGLNGMQKEIVWLKGGRGGLGNSNFATATQQVPEYAQPGEDGTEGWKQIELKVLAEIGRASCRERVLR